MRRFGFLNLVALFIVATFIVPLDLYGQQNQDSLTLVTADWNAEQLNKNVTFKQAVFKGTLFSSNQIISIIEIKGVKGKRKSPKFIMAYEQELTPTSEMAKKAGAFAAVNGNFFSFKKPHNSVDYIKVDNIEVCKNENNGKGARDFNKLGVIAIDGKGRLSFHKPDVANLDWEAGLDYPYVMTAGPLLMIDGKKEQIQQISFNTVRHPRTAVALKDNGDVLLFVVDGRNEQAHGMSMEELQKSLSWLGAAEALNLDGGGSSTMYIYGKEVVNFPSDNKKLDHFGERRVANSLLLLLPQAR